jgi:hypothetical protein
VGLVGATDSTPKALLRIEQPAKINGVANYGPASTLQSERGAYVIPLQKGTTWIELKAGLEFARGPADDEMEQTFAILLRYG